MIKLHSHVSDKTYIDPKCRFNFVHGYYHRLMAHY